MSRNQHTTTAVAILGALFFLFGFVTWTNGPLISYLKIICELKTGAEPFYVTFAFYIAYFVTALPMAWVLGRTGMKNGMQDVPPETVTIKEVRKMTPEEVSALKAKLGH